jgi:hypothetical protein
VRSRQPGRRTRRLHECLGVPIGDPGTPGSSPTNPVTQSGPPEVVQPVVDVKWEDNSTESIPLGTFSGTTKVQDLGVQAQTAVAARAEAEHRRNLPIPPIAPTGSRKPASVSRTSEDDFQIYWCIVGDGTPYKSSGQVWTSVAVGCSSNVEGTSGWIFLYRGAGFTLIGAGNSSGGPYTLYGAVGSCASSTWQYNSSLSYTMETEAGDADFDHDWGPKWISC